MKKFFLTTVLLLALLIPGAAFAIDCDIYESAIKDCAKQGCDTDMNDFAQCLVDEHGVTEAEAEEIGACIATEYECK
ncbi:MAG: hypothetical protein H7A23_13140 [Leptospiraceae bacterium]|nr:hypothetical protein [Leptospiraceae bacterium]MCP5495494.1 hypothetical protein [Leptospiraceae bacterium]